MDSGSVGVLFLCLVCAVASSLVPVAELFQPKMYKSANTDKENRGVQQREKVDDLKSSHGIVNEPSVEQLIEFERDKGGHQVEEKVKGTVPSNIAGIKTLVDHKTVDAKGTELPMKEASLAQFEQFYKNMADVYKEILASGQKDFFKDAILATKIKGKEAEAGDSKIKLDLLALYKLGLILPKIFEMYSTEKGVITQASARDKLDYLKYPELDEFLLLSLLKGTKDVPQNDVLFSFANALTKLNDGAFKFVPMGTKRYFPSFGKEDSFKDADIPKGLRNIHHHNMALYSK